MTIQQCAECTAVVLGWLLALWGAWFAYSEWASRKDDE